MKDREPAFPTLKWAGSLPDGTDEYLPDSPGMALRDYLASKAMQSLILCKEAMFEHIPVQAYRYADAMLAQREKK